MKSKTYLSALLLILAGSLISCSTTSATKAPDVTDNIRNSLAQAGLKDVKTDQDRDKGVITLGGHVAADRDKEQADSIARSFAGSQVVANQIEVIPFGDKSVEKDVRQINSDLDKGIESNLNAALINERLHDSVKYKVRNLVVTLTGNVNSQVTRGQAEDIAAHVPNVHQVVNELQVKKQKATSSN